MWLNSAMTLAVAPGGSVIARLVSVIAVLDVLSLPGSTGQSYPRKWKIRPKRDKINATEVLL